MRLSIITASGRYLKSAKKVGIRDVVTTRPQSLMALLEFIGGAKITPTEFVVLFENPMLIYAVSRAWDDVKTLLGSGIELQGKNLPRLRWDLDRELHSRITAVSNAEAKADADGENADLSLGDSEYILPWPEFK